MSVVPTQSSWASRRVQVCALLLAAVLLAAIAGPWWLPVVGRFLVVADPARPTDAVVALAGGGPHRVTGAAEVLNAGNASWLIVTNQPLNTPGIREEYADLMRREAVWQGVAEERILRAPGTVTTTFEEALTVRALMEERGFRSLTIVTDEFHTRRARVAFHDAFRGSGITLVVRPVSWYGYSPDSWWRDLDMLRITANEYLKTLLYWLGHR